MDVYPSEYMCHNLPLMLVSGLTKAQQSPTSLSLEIPRVEPSADIIASDEDIPQASELLRAFLDRRFELWEESAIRVENRKSQQAVFRTLVTSKNYRLPEKKSGIMSPRSASSSNSSALKYSNLHSPLSPLSHESPLYPDGLITPLWLKKYQYYVPAVFVACREIFTGTEDVHAKADHDNELIKELNELKKHFTDRGVKFTVFIVSRKSVLQSIDLNDRISYLRKGTGLDARTGLFFVPPCSTTEIITIVKEFKQALYPVALDFYSNLLKHSRRKRGRNAVPSGSVSPGVTYLSLTGWNLRYEFKQAVFAEFRQEIEVAIKLYGIAYESLLDYFESIDVDNVRWNEARLLLDSIAVKILKFNLYLNQPVMAQKVFNVHIESVTALVEKHFRTTYSYSFLAWKARQHQMLAQVLDHAPEQLYPRSVPFAGVAGDIIGPDFPSSNVLHNSGFQYLYAARLTMERQAIAMETIEEPKDLYLVSYLSTEKNFDHTSLIVNLLESAYSRFDKGDGTQNRMQSYIAYQIAHLLFKQAKYSESLNYYRLSESLYRKERWFGILETILLESAVASKMTNDVSHYIQNQFERISSVFTNYSEQLASLPEMLNGFDKVPSSRTIVKINYENIISFIDMYFAFMTSEVHVASVTTGQLTLRSCHTSTIGQIAISSILIEFTNDVRAILIENDEKIEKNRVEKIEFNEKTLEDGKEVSLSKANLNFDSGEIRTFEFCQLLKKLGVVRLKSVVITFSEPKYSIELLLIAEDMSRDETMCKWWIQTGGKLLSRRIPTQLPHSIKIIPKPAHVDIVHYLKGPAYIGERLSIPISITSKEIEPLRATATVVIQNVEGQINIPAWWGNSIEKTDSLDIGEILPSSPKFDADILVQMPSEMCDLVVEVVFTYYLASNPEVPITKTYIIDLPVTFPFHISYDLSPRIHPKKWPSPFFIYELQSHSPPITKRWCLSATVDAVDLTHLEIVDYDFEINNAIGIDCELIKTVNEGFERKTISDVYNQKFILDVTNNDSIERRNTTAAAKMSLKWRRVRSDDISSERKPDDAEVNTFDLPILKLTFPLLEPRVLLDVISTSPEVVRLAYFIENATSHILTFSVTLDLNNEMVLSYPMRYQIQQQSYQKEVTQETQYTKDQEQALAAKEKMIQQGRQVKHANFAFEGAKQIGVRVLPYTSRKIEFKLIPLGVTSGWQTVPLLRVYDTHFKKSLSVFPASDKFRIDLKSGLVFVNISDRNIDSST
ncbi:Gryzun, putative trafficking through golgi-domain-containing protein [Dipodascopsis uninucleata]